MHVASISMHMKLCKRERALVLVCRIIPIAIIII